MWIYVMISEKALRAKYTTFEIRQFFLMLLCTTWKNTRFKWWTLMVCSNNPNRHVIADTLFIKHVRMKSIGYHQFPCCAIKSQLIKKNIDILHCSKSCSKIMDNAWRQKCRTCRKRTRLNDKKRGPPLKMSCFFLFPVLLLLVFSILV